MELQTTTQKIIKDTAKTLARDAHVFCQILQLRISESGLTESERRVIKKECDAVIQRGIEARELLAAS